MSHDPRVMNASELEVFIKAQEAKHNARMRHLRALLRVVQDMDQTDDDPQTCVDTDPQDE